MEPIPSFSTSIISSLSSLWKDETLADFTLVVDDSIFKCHRFILGACSHFFHALFTTDMKEKKDNSARLPDIDSSAFELILKILYTGENLVTKENVFSIWQCAHRLQITFLVEYCEKLSNSILSINNFAEFARAASVFGSQTTQENMKKYILKNFMKIKDNKVFYEFSAARLTEIIQSDELEVSCEDDVLFFLYNWAEGSVNGDFGFKRTNGVDIVISDNSDMPVITLKDGDVALNSDPNSEKLNNDTNSNGNVPEMAITKQDMLEVNKEIENVSVQLESLLKASRSCLASPRCLQTLYKHRLTKKDDGVKAVIIDAIFYQMKGNLHGYFPPAALHRNFSEFKHVGVIAHKTGHFEALSLTRQKWCAMPACWQIKNKIKIALFDGNIYAVGQAGDLNSKLCVLKENSWANIAELPGLRYLLLSHKSFLYAFNASNANVYCVNPNSFEKTPKKLKPSNSFTDLEFALSFQESILVFSQDNAGDKEETAVHIMNTSEESWQRIVNLDGPAKKMASFQDGDKVYLLQNNGNLWSISTDDVQIVKFEFIKKIWEVKESLRGALLYKGTLVLFLKLPWVNEGNGSFSSLPGIFTYVKRWAIDKYASNFIFTVMHNLALVEK